MADTGFKNPTAIATPNEWLNPSNAFSSNDAYTNNDFEDAFEQGYITFTFGLPSGATIDGIEVQVEAREGTDPTSKAGILLSWNAGTNYTARKDTPGLSGTDAYYTLGGSTDTWGRTWIDTELNDTNFKLKLYAVSPGFEEILVDHIQVKVYYTEATTTSTTSSTSTTSTSSSTTSSTSTSTSSTSTSTTTSTTVSTSTSSTSTSTSSSTSTTTSTTTTSSSTSSSTSTTTSTSSTSTSTSTSSTSSSTSTSTTLSTSTTTTLAYQADDIILEWVLYKVYPFEITVDPLVELTPQLVLPRRPEVVGAEPDTILQSFDLRPEYIVNAPKEFEAVKVTKDDSAGIIRAEKEEQSISYLEEKKMDANIEKEEQTTHSPIEEEKQEPFG